MQRNRLLVLCGVAALLVLASACSGAKPHDNAAVGQSPPPSAAGQPSPASSGSDPATTPPATPSPKAAPPGTCPVTDLAVKLGSSQGAAGHILDVFTVTNTGSSQCELDGYPALTLLSSSGSAVAANYSHGADMAFPAEAPHPVHLAAGQTASFSVGYPDVPSGSQGSCATAAAVKVNLPATPGSATVHTGMSPCGTVDVSPVVAGSNGA